MNRAPMRRAWLSLFAVLTLWILALMGDCACMAIAEHRIQHENLSAEVSP